MALHLRKGVVKYKGEDGTYKEINAVGESHTEELKNEINTAVSEAKTELAAASKLANDNISAITAGITSAMDKGTDTSLSLSGVPADAKAVGELKGDLTQLKEQFEAPIQEQVDNYLDRHPEATTTVQDGSLSAEKMTDELKLHTLKDYVTPEMYGAVGDGITDDANAIQSAINTEKVVLLTKQYFISKPLVLNNNTKIMGNKISVRYSYPEDTTYIKNESGKAFFTSASGGKVTQIQMSDFSLWNDGESTIFDCEVERSDFTIYGFNVHKFANKIQACRFRRCHFLSTVGTFSEYTSDTQFEMCYFSGKKTSESPLLKGVMSSVYVRGCYFDFWHTVFNPTSLSANNMVVASVFDACYRVFVGAYNGFGVIDNSFMRIYDSDLWSLGKDDWCVFGNGLRTNTRSIGNSVDADYYIHTRLTGNSYPNKNSISFGNSLSDRTKIDWTPYPNDANDLVNTRIEEINYKHYDVLPNASIVSGTSERFNHQIAESDDALYINNNGTWVEIGSNKTFTKHSENMTIQANSSRYISVQGGEYKAKYYYIARPTANLPLSLSYCCYCYTDTLLRIIITNPTNSSVEVPAMDWVIKVLK